MILLAIYTIIIGCIWALFRCLIGGGFLSDNTMRLKNMNLCKKKLPSKCFISHSYKEHMHIELLKRTAHPETEFYIFPPIDVTPEEMVSNELLKAIDSCNSLTYLTGPDSKKSPWVTLERDYALRNSKPVFCFDLENREIREDTSSPMYLPAFASYLANARSTVLEITKFMSEERSIDVFVDSLDVKPGENFGDAIDYGIINKLERGGYVIIFHSKGLTDSEFIDIEIEAAKNKYSDRILIVSIDDTSLPATLCYNQPIYLYDSEIGKINYNRVDDLIVRLYWLIERNTKA